MRKTALTMIAAAALGVAALAPTSGSAAPAAAPITPAAAVQTVQYWGVGPHHSDNHWERRRQWRERRRERDDARIGEAARREAWPIEQEREQRRAWRHAQREQRYGHGPGYYRGW